MLKPLREPSKGLTFRRASYVVPLHNRDELTARCPMALYRCCASTHDAMVRSTSDTIRVVCVDTCGMTRVRLLARRERAEFADTKSPRTADRQVECDNRQPY